MNTAISNTKSLNTASLNTDSMHTGCLNDENQKAELLKLADIDGADGYCIANCVFYVLESHLCKAVAGMPGFEPFCVSHGVPVSELLSNPYASHSHPSGQSSSDEAMGEADVVPPFYICFSENPMEAEAKCQYTFQSDGVDSEFASIGTGYALQMKHENGMQMQLWSDTSHRLIYIHGDLLPQMLRFALWIAFGVMTVNYHRIPIHGSCIMHQESAYLFLGESGTGKSTHTRLWREYISGSSLLNDDSPIIACETDGMFIYGSPWSGKTPCYKPLKLSLGGCVRLSQAPFNKIQRLSPLKAYAALHPSCPPEFAYDEALYAGISQTLDGLLSSVPVYHLACLPDEAAALLSFTSLTNQ